MKTGEAIGGPPHYLEAERSCLGCCLQGEWDEGSLIAVLTELSEDDFYHPQHRYIFKAICSLQQKGVVTDLITLTNELMVSGNLNSGGGADYIAGLGGVIATINLTLSYTEIVQEHSQMRKLERLGNELVAFATRPKEKKSREIGTWGTDRLFQILNRDKARGSVDLAQAIKNVDAAQREYHKHDYYNRLRTGFSGLDNMVTMLPGKVYCLAGYTSQGKSAFAMCVASNMIQNDIPVQYISIEMDEMDMVYRMACVNEEGSDLGALTRGDIRDIANHPGLQSTAKYHKNLHICDLEDASELEIGILMQQQIMRNPETGLIIIDYLQNIDCERNPRLNRHLQLSSVGRYFRKMAKRLKVPVLLLSQLRRPVTKDGKRTFATIYDLKESGDIENTVDGIFLIHRLQFGQCKDWYGFVQIAKQRMGVTGQIGVYFTGMETKFEEVAIPDDVLEDAGFSTGVKHDRPPRTTRNNT